MTYLTKLKELAERATPGPWTLYVPENYQGPEELPGYGVECAEGRAIIWGALEPETGCQFDRDAEFIAAANPKAILGLIAEVERLRSALQGVHAEVDGNIRPLTRDLVNMVSGVKNGSHPNDIYDHCDEIDRIIDAALEGGGR